MQTESGQSPTFPCRVAWSRRVGLRRCLVGVEFIELDEAQQAEITRIAMMHVDRRWIHDGSNLAA